MLNIAQALRLSTTSSAAFVGAGGKTTALFMTARQLAPALVATTAHLGDWQIAPADRHFIWAEDVPLPDIEAQIGTGITLITGPLHADHRYSGLSFAQPEKLRQLAGYHDLPLLLEADGSRQKSLKAPAEHEPIIPSFVGIVVVVAGLSGLNQPLSDETVHRAGLFSALGGLGMGENVTAEALARVLAHPQGGLKIIPGGARRLVLLNQADTTELQAAAHSMAEALLQAYEAVIVAALSDGRPSTVDRELLSIARRPPSIFARHDKIAGIILAAGEASRFGRPKQLLDYHGRPFVRAVAETALAAGLSPVIVVTGAHAEMVESALSDLPITITRNDEWKDGQSGAVKKGINALSSPLPGPPPFSESSGKWGRVGGAIFLLVDQPQVTPRVLRALVERHAVSGAPIIAPLAMDRRANPVLFDCDTFKDLLALSGDVGGRALFSKYQVDYLPWHDESLLLDVDTEDDYRKLLAWGVKD